MVRVNPNSTRDQGCQLGRAAPTTLHGHDQRQPGHSLAQAGSGPDPALGPPQAAHGPARSKKPNPTTIIAGLGSGMAGPARHAQPKGYYSHLEGVFANIFLQIPPQTKIPTAIAVGGLQIPPNGYMHQFLGLLHKNIAKKIHHFSSINTSTFLLHFTQQNYLFSSSSSSTSSLFSLQALQALSTSSQVISSQALSTSSIRMKTYTLFMY